MCEWEHKVFAFLSILSLVNFIYELNDWLLKDFLYVLAAFLYITADFLKVILSVCKDIFTSIQTQYVLFHCFCFIAHANDSNTAWSESVENRNAHIENIALSIFLYNSVISLVCLLSVKHFSSLSGLHSFTTISMRWWKTHSGNKIKIFKWYN